MERTTTPVKEVEGKYRHSGVVVFIFDNKGRVLITRERNLKETAFESGAPRVPDKLGVITETREPGEEWSDTFFRGFREELGIDLREHPELLTVDENSYIGETLFSEGVLATVLKLHCSDPAALFKAIKPADDVDVLGFLPIDTFRKSGNIRYGVGRVLDECVSSGLFIQSK